MVSIAYGLIFAQLLESQPTRMNRLVNATSFMVSRKSNLSLLLLACTLVITSCGPSGPKSESPLFAGTMDPAVNDSKGAIDPRPDIVVVVADDMRWDLMSGEGHPFLNTPNLDDFASSAAKMNNAFVPVALCSPSRAAILTGREPHQASAPGIAWRNNSFLQTQRTFVEDLQAAGYITAYIGKWHLGDGSKPKRGFDHWESFDWLGDFFDPEVFVNGEERAYKGYADDVLSARAEMFMQAHKDSSKPVFLMVGLKAPHLRFEHPARHKDAFADVDIPKPDTYEEDFSISGKLKAVKDWLGMDTYHCGLNCFDNSWDKYIKYHYRAILGLDDSIGTLRAATEHRNKQDNTLFIYTSDNGYSLGDHGLTEKHMVYEEPVRVPFLIDFPSQDERGLQFDGLVSTLDIAPTALDYAGVTQPLSMTGRSLRPIVDAQRSESAVAALQAGWRKQIFLTYDDWQIAIRTDRYKYIESLKEAGHIELYDLQTDPKETQTVHNDPSYADVLATLQLQLEQEIEDNGWTERLTYPIKKLLVSSPIPVAQADVVAKQVSQAGTPAVGAIDEFGLSWTLVDRTEAGMSIGTDVAAGNSVLLALPIERVVGWDPHIKIRLGGNYRYAMYSNGTDLWDNYKKRPIDYPNPPLGKADNLMVMRLDGSGDIGMTMDLVVARDTIRLPLEDKLLAEGWK